VKPITLRRAIAEFNKVVDVVEGRCMAADGPVTPTMHEITDGELARLWKAVQVIRQATVPCVAAAPDLANVTAEQVRLVREAGEMFVESHESPGEPADRQNAEWHDGKKLVALAVALEQRLGLGKQRRRRGLGRVGPEWPE